MQKLAFLLFLALGFIAHAQTHRFTYEYKYIPDSTKRSEVMKEMMLLDIDKKGSKYYSYDKFVQDSTVSAELKKQIESGSRSINIKRNEKSGKVGFTVTKDYPDFKTSLLLSLSQDKYKVIEDQKPEWKILPDKEKIGDYNAQKATTNFGGRQWTAWFTTDIPFQDGPYKFYGLPGLIVKVVDKSGDFDMTLVGNKTILTTTESESNSINSPISFAFGNKEIEVSEKQFKKVYKDYVADPTKNMRQMMTSRMGADGSSSVTVFRMKDASGKEIDQNQMFRQMEKRVKEDIAKNNNKIEPDLYKPVVHLAQINF